MSVWTPTRTATFVNVCPGVSFKEWETCRHSGVQRSGDWARCITFLWHFRSAPVTRHAIFMARSPWEKLWGSIGAGGFGDWMVPAVQLEDCSINLPAWLKIFGYCLSGPYGDTRGVISFRSSLLSCVKPWRNHVGTIHTTKFTHCIQPGFSSCSCNNQPFLYYGISSHELIWVTIMNTIQYASILSTK